MTDDEKTVLTQYLIRLGAISAPADFEEWYRISTDSKDGADATVTLLGLARAYDLGLRDANVQAEAWVEGIRSTYDRIIEKLMALRNQPVNPDSTGSPWQYLPVGPEGPRPWGNAT